MMAQFRSFLITIFMKTESFIAHHSCWDDRADFKEYHYTNALKTISIFPIVDCLIC
jgi:hypothetical protein